MLVCNCLLIQVTIGFIHLLMELLHQLPYNTFLYSNVSSTVYFQIRISLDYQSWGITWRVISVRTSASEVTLKLHRNNARVKQVTYLCEVTFSSGNASALVCSDSPVCLSICIRYFIIITCIEANSSYGLFSFEQVINALSWTFRIQQIVNQKLYKVL